MTTKEFIEMLQKEDPSGEGHIRIGHYCTFYAESKEGYWDGPYSYLKDNKWGKDMVWKHTSTGYKVDIHCVDVDQFVEYFDGDFNEVKKHLEFDYSNYCDKKHRKDKENGILKIFEESCTEHRKIMDKLNNDEYEDAIKHVTEGWKWFQNKEVDNDPFNHTYYTWKIFDKDNNLQISNVWNTEPVLKSGKWEKCDNNVIEGYYQWIYKNN